MEALDVARWQFGVTTVYHFIFVPLTIGLSLLVAIMQTVAFRAKDPVRKDAWTRITKFFGSMLIINFAIGAATGIVQEFQFGMNWSEYSRFVGDVFGAPLAFEGLAAFFLESVFLGLWVFGWKHMSAKVHLVMIWCVAIGTALSAYFIIAANSFMQHPVGARFNPDTGRAELDSIWAVLTNVTTLAAFPHVIAGAWLTAGAFVTGIAAWHMVNHHNRAAKLGEVAGIDDAHLSTNVFRPAVRFGVITMFISGLLLFVTGDMQGKLMFEQQPMKMASAEALCHTETGASFSVLTIGGPNAFHQNCETITHLIEIPYVTSILATNNPNATLKGVTELEKESTAKYGDTVKASDGTTIKADYRPNLFVTYWGFRLMIGLAGFSAILAFWALWVTRGGRTTGSSAFKWFAALSIPMPFLANSAGWIFTEMGRQPWVVAPNPNGVDQIRLMTAQGVSHNPAWQVITSLTTFTLLYAVLMVVWFELMRRNALKGIKAPKLDKADDELDTPALSFGY